MPRKEVLLFLIKQFIFVLFLTLIGKGRIASMTAFGLPKKEAMILSMMNILTPKKEILL